MLYSDHRQTIGGIFMEKLVKTARTLDVFLKIAEVMAIVGAIILIVFDLLFLIFSASGTLEISDGVVIGVTFGKTRLVLATGAEGDVYEFVKAYTVMCTGAVVMLAVAYAGIRLFRKILAPMKEGAPFAEGISRDIKRFGIFTLIAGIAGGAVQFALSLIVNAIFSALAKSGTLVSETLDYLTVDGNFILVAVVAFLLSYVFKYGEELQRQSDETL